MAARNTTVIAIGWVACAAAALFAFARPLRPGVAEASGRPVGASAKVDHAEQVREITVRGDNYAYTPSRFEVQKDEIVKVTFTAVDMPHSFTIDGYRISKRAAAGQTVTFEFRADRTGPFRFYCNLTQDDRCREMHGELSVK